MSGERPKTPTPLCPAGTLAAGWKLSARLDNGCEIVTGPKLPPTVAVMGTRAELSDPSSATGPASSRCREVETSDDAPGIPATGLLPVLDADTYSGVLCVAADLAEPYLVAAHLSTLLMPGGHGRPGSGAPVYLCVRLLVVRGRVVLLRSRLANLMCTSNNAANHPNIDI